MAENLQKEVKELIDGLGTWFNKNDPAENYRMTGDLHPYNELFSPIQVNKTRIKNRLVMGPMGNVDMADEMGKPSTKMIEYFLERAKGGTGLLTTGLVPATFKVDPTVEDVDNVGILPRFDGHRTPFSGWINLAKGVHSYGSKIFLQITPGFGRVGNPECMLKKKKLPVSASWNRNFYIPQLPCRPLTDGECRKIIKGAGQCASDARAIEIDGVYLHGHEGYLLDQMTNPAFNRRKLGRFANWQNFGLDMVKEIRTRCGKDYPIMYRIDLSLALNETYGARMLSEKRLKSFRKDRSVEMTLDFMKNLVAAGVDMFDVDLGCYDNWWLPHPPMAMPPGCFLEISRIVKDFFRNKNIISNAGYPVPVVGVGKLGFPDLAEKALRDGKCDMVMLARPLLADPNWANKAYAGRVKEIIPCIGDQEGCLNQLIHGGHPQCAVNPRTSFEHIMLDDRAPALNKKKVAVVGAGPAGVSCALQASLRGHEVVLYDKNPRIGGMLLVGSVPKIKFEIRNYIEHLEEVLHIQSEKSSLTVKLDTDVNEEMLKADGFDSIVTCTGSTPLLPPVEGIDLPHVYQGIDILKNPSLAADAEKIVIVGGADVGCEIAYMLSLEMGKKDITIVEMLGHLMQKSCTANRGFIIHNLEKAGVKVMNCTRLKKLSDKNVILDQNVSKTVPDPFVTWTPVLPENIINPFAADIKADTHEKILSADLVIVCTGARPNQTLFEECMKNNTAGEVHNIGDSMMNGKVHEATKAGHAIGKSL